jgi:hypothetical protein
MSQIPRSECASALANLELNTDPLPQERSLGVLWNTEKDLFTFKYEPPSKPDTRRGVLSTVASDFDPLGLISPFILKGKIILQESCRRKAEWDSPLEPSLLSRWSAWKSDLNYVDQITIPRCITPHDFGSIASAQLHTFADASTVGHGHCTYLRLVNSMHKVHVSLLASKSKVAPIKQVTVPRLELQAASGAVRSVHKYTAELDLPNLTAHFYSDSTVVLGYIANTGERFHTYVANRVETIRTLSNPNNWKHVPTTQNPADLSSRGASTQELNSSHWFTGPEFLWTEPLILPSQPQLHINPNDVEVKQSSSTLVTCHDFSLDSRLKRFSNWKKAVRAIATIQKHMNKQTIPDLHQARQTILMHIQQEYFS